MYNRGIPVAVTSCQNKLWKLQTDVKLCYIIIHPDSNVLLWNTEYKGRFENDSKSLRLVIDTCVATYRIPYIEGIKRGDVITSEQQAFLLSKGINIFASAKA